MKKRNTRRGISLLLVICMVMGLCVGCGKEKELKTVHLNEVAHSIFYAPQYVAIEKGYFEDEGIALELVNGMGADNTMTAVLSGEADVGFMGSESSIYVAQEGAKDKIINFAQLTQRAGNFLVGKSADEDFQWTDLKGKTVLGGREGGMPEMVFEKDSFELLQDILQESKVLTQRADYKELVNTQIATEAAKK